jgi:hypothetical protein
MLKDLGGGSLFAGTLIVSGDLVDDPPLLGGEAVIRDSGMVCGISRRSSPASTASRSRLPAWSSARFRTSSLSDN